MERAGESGKFVPTLSGVTAVLHPFRFRRGQLIIFAGLTGLVGAIARAGPLDPPAGPVASSGKTLSEVEPRIAINAVNTPGDADSLFRISQPGSYYLTGNITGVAAKVGIEIAASGVTIDLVGFELAGVAGSLDGIRAGAAGFRNITVRNGSVRGWGNDGIDLVNPVIDNGRIEGISVGGNGGAGIATTNSAVMNCTARGNAGAGIFASQSTIGNCTANGNSGLGISVSANSTITDCTANNNSLGGISAGGSTVTDCTAANNDSTGIVASGSSRITNCSATSNAGNGIAVSGGSNVSGCTADLNDLDGITLASDCMAVNNSCDSNGASGVTVGGGIRVTGSDNRIEGNNCTDGDYGIQCSAAGNIIIRNTCSGNATNWDIAANNVVGPILNRTAPGSAAILGDSAPSSLGSTEPNANFTY